MGENQNNKFVFYDTIGVQKIFNLNKRIRCVAGGTSASKTIGILFWHIDYAQTRKNRRMDIMSETYPHLEDGAIKDFKEIMIDRGYWKDRAWNESKHQYTFPTGTVLKFKSIDKLSKSKGPRRDTLFLNEVNHIALEIYNQLEPRTKEIVWMDWNPDVEFWYYTELKDKVDHDFLKLTYLDCKDPESGDFVLDKRIVESIESRKDNKRWWQVYGLGELGEVEGRIFTGWKIIDEVPHEARLERRGLDFGYSVDPTVVEAIYNYNGGFIIDEEIYRKGLSNRTIAETIQNLKNPGALVIADSAEPKSIDEIRDYGLNIIGANKGPGSVLQGIQYVQDQPISVTKRSLKTITAYRNYVWKTDKATGQHILVPDDSIHEWSNPMDAIRYGFNSYRPGIENPFKNVKPKRLI
jgi:phage terminase large subunit